MGQENMDDNTGLKSEKDEILVVTAYCRLKRGTSEDSNCLCTFGF